MVNHVSLSSQLDAVVVAGGAPSARDLLVTIFGDAIVPHGRSTAVSVSALGELLASFGVNDRLVRTSLSRLANDGLLTTSTKGRRSFYRIAESSYGSLHEALEKTYENSAPHWDGEWTMVVFDNSDACGDGRADLRTALVDIGMGAISPAVLMAAHLSVKELKQAVEDHPGVVVEDLQDHSFITRARTSDAPGEDSDKRVAAKVYPIPELDVAYENFVARFEPFASWDVARHPPEEAFKLRTLMVTAYRRIRLDFPHLPPSLLPDPWIGILAERLAARIYRDCADASEEFLTSVLSKPDGVLNPLGFPPLMLDLTQRFAEPEHAAVRAGF